MPSKVFIFNGEGVDDTCLADTVELFRDNHILDNPDIMICNFDSNFDGLSPARDNVSLIIPGGSAVLMSDNLSEKSKETMNTLIKQGGNFVGLCAGAYMGISTYVYATGHKMKGFYGNQSLDIPNQIKAASGAIVNFDLSRAWSSHGHFYPSRDYYLMRMFHGDESVTPENLISNNYAKPYVVSLNFTGRQKTASTLYIRGCGFLKNTETSDLDVLATYPEEIELSADGQVTKHANMAAILSRPRDKDNQTGGVFLSGLHLESSVKHSRLFGFFSEQKSQGTVPLDEAAIKKLSEDRDTVLELTVNQMRAALS